MDAPIPLTAKLTPHTFALKFPCPLTPIHHLPPPHILGGSGRSLCPSCFPTIFSATRTRFLLFFSSCSPSRPNKLLCPLFGPAFSQTPDPTYHQCDHPDCLVRNGAVTLDNPKQQFLCRLRTPPLPIILRHQSSQPYRNIGSRAPMYKLVYSRSYIR